MELVSVSAGHLSGFILFEFVFGFLFSKWGGLSFLHDDVTGDGSFIIETYISSFFSFSQASPSCSTVASALFVRRLRRVVQTICLLLPL